jgi:hypothetical protein
VNDEEVLRAEDGLGVMATIPILIGLTKNEERYFIKPGQPRDEKMLEAITRVMGREQADSLLVALNALDGELYDRLDKIFTSSIWAEPAFATERIVSPSIPGSTNIASTGYRPGWGNRMD